VLAKYVSGLAPGGAGGHGAAIAVSHVRHEACAHSAVSSEDEGLLLPPRFRLMPEDLASQMHEKAPSIEEEEVVDGAVEEAGADAHEPAVAKNCSRRLAAGGADGGAGEELFPPGDSGGSGSGEDGGGGSAGPDESGEGVAQMVKLAGLP